jgi:hypothetical protein
MTVAAIETSESLIAWRYLSWALTAIAVMVAAILAGNLWLLNFIHVFSSLLWTGIDLFMGFVLGPILRRVDLSVRRQIVRRLTPRTLFLMPTVSIISGTTGWFLAVDLGYTALEWPAYGWVAAALVLVTLMTIQGLGFLTPCRARGRRESGSDGGGLGSSAAGLWSTPIRRIRPPCCAPAASGQAAAALPSSVMNSRRLIIRSPRRRGRAASAALRGRAPSRS